jgi:hypothetical protein
VPNLNQDLTGRFGNVTKEVSGALVFADVSAIVDRLMLNRETGKGFLTDDPTSQIEAPPPF